MLYLTLIGIVCAVAVPVGAFGIRISNETDVRDRNFGSRKVRELLWVASESFKLDLSGDFDEDVARTRRITTRIWMRKKKKRSVKTNLRDVAADEEIDMNKRIERLAREISQHSSAGDTATGDLTTATPTEELRQLEAGGSRAKRRAHKRRRMSLLNPFKRKPSYNEQSTQNSVLVTSTEHTACMGVFERKMKEFRAQQKLKMSSKCPVTPVPLTSVPLTPVTVTPVPLLPEDIKYRITTQSTTLNAVQDSGTKETTPTTFLPPYVIESADFALRNDEELSPERYLKIRHALRNYLMKMNGKGRRKRCNRPNCATRKCKKAPPLVCLPFIKRGQDDILKFMISVMQSMLDKSCNSRKPYALDKLRRKTCRPDDSWESIEAEVLTGCETTTACPKMAQCGPFAILPFPLPFPPCTCPSPPVTQPSTTLPPCPPLCPPTTPIIPLPPLPQPCPIICPDIPRSRPCDSFTPPTMIIPTYFPPWPTTKSPCPAEPGPRPFSSSFERNVIPSCCMDTLPPWPTPPSFIKTSHFRRRIPVYHQRINKMADYQETGRIDVNNPDGGKVNRYEFESVYDSPGQETIEEAEIDVRSRHFDYDPENTIDFSVFDITTPSYDQSKMKKFPRRNYRRRYPNRLKNDFSRRYDRRYMSSRQKRNEVSDEDADGTTTTVTTAITTADVDTKSSDHRSQYDSYVNKKKQTTMRSAAIVRAPKRPSNHPQAKVFAKVFPESYSDIPAESSTAKVEKTTVAPTANASSLMHLQLLAVCEGYLEMIKLLKVNNQTRGEDELIRYCENEISKGFDSGRAKKSIETTTVAPSTDNYAKQLPTPTSRRDIRNKVVVDILRSPVYREMKSHFLARNADRVSRRRRKKRRRGFRRKPFRRTSTEIVDSVRLLRKKKGALVSWLFNKETGDVEDEEEDGGGTTTDRGNTSTTSSVRRKETSATPQQDTLYPIYAKRYGYDRGGELSDIEVLLRSLSERNETREIARNLTVLAMLMDPEEEEKDTGLVEEVESELKHDSANFGGKARGEIERKKGNASTTVAEEEEVNEMIEEEETTLTEVSSSEATTILGHVTTAPPRKNHTWNGTYALAVSTAKELVKDYTIEFLNYAVYIIPIMFILLFLVCCLCFILKIMTHNRKKRKRGRGKRKTETPPSTESESETSESSINRKRKKSKSDEIKRRSKKLWLAMRSRGNGDEEGGIARKWKRRKGKSGEGLDSDEKKFLRRLRRKKKDLEDVEEDENEEKALVSEKKRVSYNDSNDTDEPDTRIERHREAVAKERRELIALLEELKNLEDRDKKESKSVFVQYMTPDCDSERSFRESRETQMNVDDFQRMSNDLSAELLRGTPRDVAYKFELLTRMFDRLLLGNVSPRKKSVLMEEMENFKRRLGYRKYTKLKDNGVLCRP